MEGMIMIIESEEYVNMDDVYPEINNVQVLLSIDKDDLIIRIPYISGDAEDIIKTVRGK
jgi:hypothetical protein